MDDVASWALIVGFFSPLLIALVQQPKWTAAWRAVVTFAYALVVGVITAWLNGSLEAKSAVSAVLVVLVMAISTYKGLWQPTKVAPAIERATSPSVGT